MVQAAKNRLLAKRFAPFFALVNETTLQMQKQY